MPAPVIAAAAASGGSAGLGSIIGQALLSAGASQLAGQVFGGQQQQQGQGFTPAQFQSQSWRKLMEQLYGMQFGPQLPPDRSLISSSLQEAYQIRGGPRYG